MSTNFKILVAMVLIAIFAGLYGCKKNESATTIPAANEVTQAVADANAVIEQKECPVMGGAIDPKIFTVYKGKKVYCCCPGCKPVFEKNPEKYISKLPQFAK